MFELFEHQLKALDKIHNGCILYGGGGHKGAAGFVAKELPFHAK